MSCFLLNSPDIRSPGAGPGGTTVAGGHLAPHHLGKRMANEAEIALLLNEGHFLSKSFLIPRRY